MRASTVRWLPCDVDLLRRLMAEGKTDREIAHAMGRTEQSVISARNRADLYRDNRTWDGDAIRRLTDLRAEGKTATEIAEAMGRAPTSIKSALERYGIRSPKPPRPQAEAPKPKAATISGKLAGPVSIARPYGKKEIAWAAANIRDRQAKLIAGLTTGELVHVFEDAPVRPGRIDVRAA